MRSTLTVVAGAVVVTAIVVLAGGGGGQWFGNCDSVDDWGIGHLPETNTFVLSESRSCWPEGQTTLEFSSFLNELGSQIDVRDEVDGTLSFVN